MTKPSHIAYVVNEPKPAAHVRDGVEQKAFWRPVGAVWPHKQGGGFDLVIYDQIAVSGRIVCTVPKDDKAEAPAQPQ
jgi:hypothetical protein